eukprot:scaffold29471_cov28-Tisochrysis_lutea.AAC.4
MRRTAPLAVVALITMGSLATPTPPPPTHPLQSLADPEPALHAMVVADDQSCQRLRRLPGATRSHRHLHAWQDSHTEDIAHPDLPRPSLAKDP